jgi:hypothetical protein
MTSVYAFERCPFRDFAHSVADRSSLARRAAGALWPAARRAERVELSDDGIAAWTLTGKTELAWEDVTGIESARTPMGRRTLRIRGQATCIEAVAILPGFAELEQRVRARPVLAAA